MNKMSGLLYGSMGDGLLTGTCVTVSLRNQSQHINNSQKRPTGASHLEVTPTNQSPAPGTITAFISLERNFAAFITSRSFLRCVSYRYAP